MTDADHLKGVVVLITVGIVDLQENIQTFRHLPEDCVLLIEPF
jgi:hypothetical protein